MAMAKGLRVHLARYEDFYDFAVAMYRGDIDPDEQPHDWWLDLTLAECMRLFGRLPPKTGHVTVRLRAEVDE